MKRTEEIYKPALQGRQIPILTLDHKWHQLFAKSEMPSQIKKLENQLNQLLKRQGKINTETKDIKKLKKKLMSEIVLLADEVEKTGSASQEKKMDESKRLINECNEKLEAYQDEMLELPRQIQNINYELMLATMEVCYDSMKKNDAEIARIAAWSASIRVELKKNLIRKQESEAANQEMYSYMHDIFGADVIEIFDMKYNPEEKKSNPPVP